MTTKIEEIMAHGARDALKKHYGVHYVTGPEDPEAWQELIATMRGALTALDAAGLAVLPKEATEEMFKEAADQDPTYPTEFWTIMRAAFDPNTWKPAE